MSGAEHGLAGFAKMIGGAGSLRSVRGEKRKRGWYRRVDVCDCRRKRLCGGQRWGVGRWVIARSHCARGRGRVVK